MGITPSPTIKILRFGILSTASIVNKLLPAFTACGTPFITTSTCSSNSDQQRYQIQLVAVASRSLEKAKEFATVHGIDHAYGSYEELLASPQIDAVYIPLPNALHKEWSIKAIQAGKHVLVEKPITLSVKDSMEIEREITKKTASSAASTSNINEIVVMEGFMAVHLQQTQQVVDAILRGAIGDVEGFYGTFTFPNVRLSGRDAPVKEGGGSLWDIGCYPIAVSRCILSALNRARQQSYEKKNGSDNEQPDYTCIAASVSGMATQVGSVVDGNVVLEPVSSTADWSRHHDRSFAGTVYFQPGSGVVMPRNALNGWDGSGEDGDALSATAPVPTLQFTSGFNGFLRRQLIIQGTLGRISISNAYHGANTDSFIIEQCGSTPAVTRAEWAATNMRAAGTTTVEPHADCPPCIYTSQLQNFASRVFNQNTDTSSSTPSSSCADLLTMPFSRGNVAVIEALYRSAAEGGRSVVVAPDQ